MAPMEHQIAVASLLLQLDLLVEPRRMSIYREEAAETLITPRGIAIHHKAYQLKSIANTSDTKKLT